MFRSHSMYTLIYIFWCVKHLSTQNKCLFAWWLLFLFIPRPWNFLSRPSCHSTKSKSSSRKDPVWLFLWQVSLSSDTHLVGKWDELRKGGVKATHLLSTKAPELPKPSTVQDSRKVSGASLRWMLVKAVFVWLGKASALCLVFTGTFPYIPAILFMRHTPFLKKPDMHQLSTLQVLNILDQMSPGALPIFLSSSRYIGISILLFKNKTKQTKTKMPNIVFFMPEKWLS